MQMHATHIFHICVFALVCTERQQCWWRQWASREGTTGPSSLGGGRWSL